MKQKFIMWLGAVIIIGFLFFFINTGHSHSTESLFHKAVDLMLESKYEESIPLLLNVYDKFPNDPSVILNLSISYERLGNQKDALKFREILRKMIPDDWRTRVKLIQLYSATDDIASRDKEHQCLYEIRKRSNDPDFLKLKMYPREFINLNNHNIVVFEYFDPKGEMMVFYRFSVRDKAKITQFHISLGSYEFTTQSLRNLGYIPKESRIYHLDLYRPEGIHKTLAFFNNKPPYDDVRSKALEEIKKELSLKDSKSKKQNNKKILTNRFI